MATGLNNGYQIGTNNQLLADGQFTYEYDHEGNRTKRTEAATGKVTEYVWDYHNRLTGVVFKDAAGVVLKNIEYIYDVNNQRIGKKIDGVVTERYVLDRNQIALIFDGQGVQKSRYLYGTQVDQVLAEESGTQVRWFLADHQGTIKDVIDNSGAVIDHITYDSFGRIVSQTNPIDLRFAYTGREWDGETGQYYYRARYYDPADGRFISEDPIGFSGEDSNLSRYVGNSPNNFIDPNGLEAAVATATVATATTTTTGGPLLSTLLLPATLVIAPVTAVFWATPTGGGRPEDTAAANKRPKLEPPLPQPPLPRPVPQPQTEPYGPPEPKTLSPAESQYWRDYYNAQDRKVERPTLKRTEPKPSPSPDPNCTPKQEEEEERKRKCLEKSGRILYRGDGRNPEPSLPSLNDGIFNQGFQRGRGKNTDLFEYANKNIASIFIGTSKLNSVAENFAADAAKESRAKEKLGYVYRICDPGTGLDVNEDLGDRSPYPKQQEVVFTNIPRKYIIGATSYTPTKSAVEY
jgi:RHS repeat-associated protein